MALQEQANVAEKSARSGARAPGAADRAPASTKSRAGKYLTFVLAEQDYGLEILKVREIIGMVNITAIPQTPSYVRGVINLRGKVIPVIDLRLRFVMGAHELTEESCIIVVDVHGIEMGVVVDKVSEVLNIAEGDIEDAPSFGVSVNTDFILGIGKTEGKVKILLDITKVLTKDQVMSIAGAS